MEKHGPEIKLAALWLMTNGQTSLIGICAASPRRFAFETGLKEEVLQRALEALPKSFQMFGDLIFIRNFIRHQFGSGDSLQKNNYFKAMKPLFLGIRDDLLRSLFLQEYPEFEGVGKPLGRAIEGVGKPQVGIGKEREGKEEEGVQREEELPPPRTFPQTAEAAARIEVHTTAGPPPSQYLAHVWNQLGSRNWRDGSGHQVVSFAKYIAKRWPSERGEWEAKAKAVTKNEPATERVNGSGCPPEPGNWREHFFAERQIKPHANEKWRDLWDTEKQLCRDIVARANGTRKP